MVTYSSSLSCRTGTLLQWDELDAAGIHLDDIERDAISLNKTEYQLIFVSWLDINDPAIASAVANVDPKIRRRFTKSERSLLRYGNGGGGDGQIPGVRDEEVINYYAELISKGTAFPPLLLSMLYGKLCLWDGWHRLCAWRSLGVSGVPAAIVTADMESIQSYLDKANAHELDEQLENVDAFGIAMSLI